MKREPCTARLTPKAAQALSELQQKDPTSARAQIIECALSEKLDFYKSIYVSEKESDDAALAHKILLAEAKKLAIGSRKEEPDAASLALAFRQCADVLYRVFQVARGRISIRKT